MQLDQQEDGAFIDNANAGNLGFYMLGWGADFPDATNFWDFHFGEGASPQFGTGFPSCTTCCPRPAPRPTRTPATTSTTRPTRC